MKTPDQFPRPHILTQEEAQAELDRGAVHALGTEIALVQGQQAQVLDVLSKQGALVHKLYALVVDLRAEVRELRTEIRRMRAESTRGPAGDG